MKDYPRKLPEINEAAMNVGIDHASTVPMEMLYQSFDQLLTKENLTKDEAKVLAGASMLIKTHALTHRFNIADKAYDKAFPLLDDLPEDEDEADEPIEPIIETD